LNSRMVGRNSDWNIRTGRLVKVSWSSWLKQYKIEQSEQQWWNNWNSRGRVIGIAVVAVTAVVEQLVGIVAAAVVVGQSVKIAEALA